MPAAAPHAGAEPAGAPPAAASRAGAQPAAAHPVAAPRDAARPPVYDPTEPPDPDDPNDPASLPELPARPKAPTHAPDAASHERPRRASFTVQRPYVDDGTLADHLFFVASGVLSVWLGISIVIHGASFGWGWYIVVLLAVWLVAAYLTLPRLHRILSSIYVPNYFIGRTRTSDGLLGDPVNLALAGTESQVHTAMKSARWTKADDITLQSTWRIVTATLTGRSYDEAPVSPLFLFGRKQDFAYQQEVDGNPGKRHHVRFWRCPDGWLLPGGRRVDWLAAGTYDRAVGFSLFTLQITHKIDENTDIERDHIVATLREARDDVRVTIIEDFSTGYHSRNGGGDSIITDGDLPIVDVRSLPVDDALDSARRAAMVFDSTALDSIAHDGTEREAATARALTAHGSTATGSAIDGAGPDAPAARGSTALDPTARAEAAAQVARDMWQRRPLALMVGCALATLAAIVGVLRFLWHLQNFDAITELRLDPTMTDEELRFFTSEQFVQGFWIGVLIASAVVVAIQLVLSVFAARGAAGARLMLMTVLLIASVGTLTLSNLQAVGRIGLLIDLSTMLMLVGALLALSSTSARQFVAAKRHHKRWMRLQRRQKRVAQRGGSDPQR